MAFYEPYSSTMARRSSFHGQARGDPYLQTSYDDSYLPRQGYGEYQQFPGQTPFPAYNAPPPLPHQPFSVPPYADSYEDSPLNEPAPYFDGHERGRTLSTGFHNGPFVAPPLGSFPSKHYRSRRASTPGPYSGVPMPMNSLNGMDAPYMQRTGASIIFKPKGQYHEGIAIKDATSNVRLSRSYQYAFHQLHLDHRGRMMVRVKWNGYRPLNYEIPVTGYDGLVSMQSLARRLARALLHFLQTNGITIPWDRVILHRLEEETHGVWLPVLTTI